MRVLDFLVLVSCLISQYGVAASHYGLLQNGMSFSEAKACGAEVAREVERLLNDRQYDWDKVFNDCPVYVRQEVLFEMLNADDSGITRRELDKKNYIVLRKKTLVIIRRLFALTREAAVRAQASVARDNRFRQRLLGLLLKAHIGIDYIDVDDSRNDNKFQRAQKGNVLSTASGWGYNTYTAVPPNNREIWERASHHLELAIHEIIEDLSKNRESIKFHLDLAIRNINKDKLQNEGKESAILVERAYDAIILYCEGREIPENTE